MIKIPTAISIAPFRFNVTPPCGHPLLGGLVMPAISVDDPLDGIGYILLGAGTPIVVCVLDWAGLMNSAHLSWRIALAHAAGTTPERVAVQCVHQHNAPFICPEAHDAVAGNSDLPLLFEPSFFDACLMEARRAVRTALRCPQRITHVAHAETKVVNVASNRRVKRDASGRVRAMRLSSCTNPELIALPDGTIDPKMQSVAFFDREKKIVSCHYYATHPMSYYGDGRVSSDFCGLARKRRQEEEQECMHLYFTGCAGNIAAGKYNDGSAESRRQLTQRIYEAIAASDARLTPQPIDHLQWCVEKVLPNPQPTPNAPALEEMVADPGLPHNNRLLAAFRLGWLRRVDGGMPFVLSCLRLNDISILHLPGEMFVEYQLRAQAMRPGLPVAVAAYGDDGLWYVPIRDEFSNNGYEVEHAFSTEEVDEIFTSAMRRLLMN